VGAIGLKIRWSTGMSMSKAAQITREQTTTAAMSEGSR
jgi:hypothetical protein